MFTQTFSGTYGIAITSFVEDAKAAVKVRKLVGDEAADFILSHLEGAAKQEIRHQPAVVATDPDKICQILLDTFGERRSMGSLVRSEVPEAQLLSALNNLSLTIQDQAKVLENTQARQGDLQTRVEKLESKDHSRGKPGKGSLQEIEVR
ncbi:hypothetical protein HOLleu_35830 [Holothuria leucospilota]|uniref:Uncharacterized protein n=1 Tax=Holothuria leucospilota TaxID=206669 RepID=A0A9Q0YNE8_HOLLE|nr:hypothetical protein HOLleu_35830 [Holothuria leucospilota]